MSDYDMLFKSNPVSLDLTLLDGRHCTLILFLYISSEWGGGGYPAERLIQEYLCYGSTAIIHF